MGENGMKLVPGRKDDPFARDVADYLGMDLCRTSFVEFRDDGGPMSGETKVEIRENLRGCDVYILWSIGYTNYELMVVLQLIDAARLSSQARRICLVCPELPNARQDKTHERRESLSSRLVAQLLEAAGLDEILTADLHSDQIEGHFRIPLDHLRTRPIWADYIRRRYEGWVEQCGLRPEGKDLVLGVPDAGRARAVRELSDEVARGLRLDDDSRILIDLAHHDKHRRWGVPGQVTSLGLLGDVQGKVVWFTDDLLSSGGTLFGAARSAKDAGARYVVCSITHAHGFDKKGRKFARQLNDSAIDELVVTDTHPRFVERLRNTEPDLAQKTTVLSLTPFFAKAIRRIRGGQTIKEMMREIDGPGELYTVIHEAAAKPVP